VRIADSVRGIVDGTRSSCSTRRAPITRFMPFVGVENVDGTALSPMLLREKGEQLLRESQSDLPERTISKP